MGADGGGRRGDIPPLRASIQGQRPVERTSTPTLKGRDIGAEDLATKKHRGVHWNFLDQTDGLIN